jgi:hypothetical protein
LKNQKGIERCRMQIALASEGRTTREGSGEVEATTSNPKFAVNIRRTCLEF